MSDDDEPIYTGGFLTGPLVDPVPSSVWNAVPNNWLTFNPCGVRINMETGEVVIPVSLTISDASRAFWDALSMFGPRGGGFR